MNSLDRGKDGRAGMRAGWEVKTLGDICDIERGGSPRPIQDFITTDPNGINWIKIGDATASGKYIYKTEEKIKPEGVKRSRLVYEGDFILSNSMSFGRPYIMKTTGCIHDGWLVLHQPKVDPDYLYHALSSDLVFEQFNRLAAGSTVRNLNIGLAKSVEIQCPPLAEQQRIVAILDKAFEGIATARKHAEQNLQNAKALFESHLEAVFSQKGDGWVETNVPLADLCELIVDCEHKTAPTQVDGIPSIRTPNIGKGKLLLDGVNRVSVETYQAWTRRAEPQAGDLIFAREAPAGNVAVVPENTQVCLGQRTVLIRPNAQILDSTFLALRILEPHLRNRLLDHSRGATVQHVNMKDIRALNIGAIPPICEQRRIASILDAISTYGDDLTDIYTQKIAALDALKKSLLHRAFSGEL